MVLPSLFEEDLDEETTVDALLATGGDRREARAGYHGPGRVRGRSRAFLSLVTQAKQALSIPVVASLNVPVPGRLGPLRQPAWRRPGRALELNIYHVSSRPGLSGSEVEWHYLDVVRAVRQAIRMPLTVKLRPYFQLAGHPGRSAGRGRRQRAGVVQPPTSPTWTSRPWRCGRRPGAEQLDRAALAAALIAILHRRSWVSLAASTGSTARSDVVRCWRRGGWPW